MLVVSRMAVEDDDTEVLCTCTHRCGPEGERVTKSTRVLHQRTQRLSDVLMSQAGPSLAAMGAESVPNPSTNEPDPSSFIQSGRDLIICIMESVEDVAALQRTYRRLVTQPIEPSSLVLKEVIKQRTQRRTVIQLDAASTSNKEYLSRQKDLRSLLSDLRSFPAAKKKFVVSMVDGLAQDISASLAQLDDILLAAVELHTQREKTYLEEGMSAEVISAGQSFTLGTFLKVLTRT